MNAWIILFIAGLLEVCWAVGLKVGEGFFNFRNRPIVCSLTLIGLVGSMWLLSVAMRSIPIGSAYAVWTGIGAVGAAIVGVVAFHEPLSPARVAFLLMVVGGIIGLKMTAGAHADVVTPTTTSTGKQTEDAVSTQPIRFFISGYAAQGKRGIHGASLDPTTGTITIDIGTDVGPNPSFIARHPTLPMLYAINEVGDFNGLPIGGVTAISIGDAGRLKIVNTQSSVGNGPCFVSITPDGRAALVANYGDGVVAALPIIDGGALGPATSIDRHVGSSADKKRQAGPHAHSITPSPDGRFALSADLGTDRITTYRIDAGPTLTPVGETAAKPGAGPRHLAFSKSGDVLYAVDEIANNITAFAYDTKNGTLAPLQTLSTLPTGYTDQSSVAEVAVHPSGKFVYVSNRGHDSIALFAVNEVDGTLALKGHTFTRGNQPRHFAIDPSGRFLVVGHQKSDNVVSFMIDAGTGELTPTGSSVTVATPSCIRFVD